MNPVRNLHKFFIDLGFEKDKKKFFKTLGDYVVVVETSKERNYTKIEGDLHTDTFLNYYNIYVSVYHKIEIEAFSMTHKDMGSFYPLTAIAEIKQSEWLANNPNLEESMKNAFLKNVYRPLFVDSKVFDFVYDLPFKRFGEYRYDSDALLMASYDEKKYDVTEKCLHTLLAIMYDPYCRETISVYDSFSVKDLIDKIDESGELKDSDRYFLAVYKRIYEKL